MTAVWLVPILVLLFGGAAMVALLRTTRESARELGAEVARFGELHVALARLRDDVRVSGRIVNEIRDR